MVRFTRKSIDTIYILSKPILVGYKIWVVTDLGYFLRWSFHSKGIGLVGYNASLYLELALTQGIIADLLF